MPVIFSLGSSDPCANSLRDWLIDSLLRDFPGLVERVPGRSTLAAALVEAGWVLPVLDGFDEMAQRLRGQALQEPNNATLPYLLTSRAAEFADLVKSTDVLAGAAVVELSDLTPDQVAGYPPLTTRKTAPDQGPGDTGNLWDPVLQQLREQPDSQAHPALADALRTPLMVALARTIYSDSSGCDPAELLRMPTKQELEDHLLANFVPTVYRRRPSLPASTTSPRRRRAWDPERAQHWLGYLAYHLDQFGDHDHQDLAWWQLGGSLPRSSRIRTTVLACALAVAAIDSLLNAPVSFANFGFTRELKVSLLVGSIIGRVFGLIYKLLVLHGRVLMGPSRAQLRMPT